jgi:threonine/homoserine/homoserine lactone efflux protein
MSFITANMALAYSAYAIGVASPGPSNLAVMATAMGAGRRAGLVFALGVISGSAIWGVLATLGLSTLMTQYSYALVIMKVLGGLYLLWLSFKSLRSALSKQDAAEAGSNARSSSLLSLYGRGAALHLTNPKAIFVWLSIITLALSNDAQRADALPILAGCLLIGSVVFCSYALLFSTQAARRIHARSRRWFDGILAAAFGAAGVRMLISR